MIIQHMPALRDHPGPGAALPNGAARLPQLGVISACGEEAADFLHRQLTQDILSLGTGGSCLAALCNAKGRVLVDFVVLRQSAHDFFLVAAADLLPLALKVLGRYQLRTRLTLADAGARWSAWGLIGAGAASAVQHAAAHGTPVLVAVLAHADGIQRTLCLLPIGVIPAVDVFPDADLWDFAQVRSGVARLSTPVSGAFTPQMLNYESAGVIHFHKGCYPGQEVIARTQFRGAVKRRAYVGRVDGAAQAGEDVFARGQVNEPCGTLVQAARAPDGGHAVIASVKVAAVQEGAPLAVGSAQGPALTDLFIPYPLQDI